MPIYVFVCKGCSVQTEIILPLSRRDEAPDCPTCGKKTERDTAQPFGVTFGKGFHDTGGY